MGQRALVLGAGGHAAIAWEIGVITGMADGGGTIRDADLIVAHQLDHGSVPKLRAI
jgi:NTE family protein